MKNTYPVWEVESSDMPTVGFIMSLKTFMKKIKQNKTQFHKMYISQYIYNHIEILNSKSWKERWVWYWYQW